ncbi:hypothetical protein THAOC_18570, partial [Thalassiosira oceanica]
ESGTRNRTICEPKVEGHLWPVSSTGSAGEAVRGFGCPAPAPPGAAGPKSKIERVLFVENARSPAHPRVSCRRCTGVAVSAWWRGLLVASVARRGMAGERRGSRRTGQRRPLALEGPPAATKVARQDGRPRREAGGRGVEKPGGSRRGLRPWPTSRWPRALEGVRGGRWLRRRSKRAERTWAREVRQTTVSARPPVSAPAAHLMLETAVLPSALASVPAASLSSSSPAAALPVLHGRHPGSGSAAERGSQQGRAVEAGEGTGATSFVLPAKADARATGAWRQDSGRRLLGGGHRRAARAQFVPVARSGP